MKLGSEVVDTVKKYIAIFVYIQRGLKIILPYAMIMHKMFIPSMGKKSDLRLFVCVKLRSFHDEKARQNVYKYPFYPRSHLVSLRGPEVNV